MVDFQRRQFFRHLVQQAKKASSTPRVVPRPPSAVHEDDFLERCSGCGLCVTACPNQIIQITNGVAQLDLELSWCSHCLQCKTVCHTGALDSPISDCLLRPTVTSNCDPQIAIYCAQCRDACQRGAITMSANHSPQINTELCNGCNACRSQCPSSAIEMSNVQIL